MARTRRLRQWRASRREHQPRRPALDSIGRQPRQWIDPRFIVSFGGIEEPEDFAARAESFARLIPLGVVSPAQAARLLHLPEPERPR